MSEQVNRLNSGKINNLNQFSPSPYITYHQNKYSQKSLLNITSLNNLNESLEFNDLEPQAMDSRNDYEPQKETPKMGINFNSNAHHFAENINHEDPPKGKNSITKTKTSTNNVNSNKTTEIIPIIQNIVSTAYLSCQLRLKEIALQLLNTQYEPKRFSGLIYRLKEPKITALIFSNGKIVVLGAKTVEDSNNACKIIARTIHSLNYPVQLKNFKIQNVVGSCDVMFPINLYKLNMHIQKYIGSSKVSFEPEIFPGLIYRLIPDKSNNNENKEKLPNIVLLIFFSGKLVISGGKNRTHIYEAFQKVYPLLYQIKEGNK